MINASIQDERTAIATHPSEASPLQKVWSREQPSVIVAQFHSFAQRMPSYYASVVVMMVAVVMVFYPVAPVWLACGIPGLTIILGSWRGLWWIQHRHDKVSEVQAKLTLRRATVTLCTSAVIVIGMDVGLFRYADLYARFFLLLQILSSTTCGFYCLMHLRRVALTIFAAMMLPFAALTLSLGHLSTSIAAVTVVLTAGVMIAAMLGYERDFFSLIQAKTESSQLNEENHRLAHRDMLTGLPNRRYFFDQIEACLSAHHPSSAMCTVGIIDLDGFKPVNDSYGHRVGDRVLEIIAGRLAELGTDLHHLCRLGGDEFVFMSAETDPERLEHLGRRIAEKVNRCITVDQRTIYVGCSVGLAVRAPAIKIDRFALFEQADYALYHAKKTGRAQTTLFSEEHATLIRDQGHLEQTLRQADIAAEFYLVFQPIVDVRTNEITAFECLARWNSPVLGEVSPARFIPVAEQAGIIGQLTQVLFKKALEQAKTWPEDIHLSFNVSPYEMASLQQINRIIDLVHQSGISPGRVAIELTETALLNNFAEVSRHMAMLRAIGASIYLDDFGTGHSSLSYIHALPLDRIKVDRSFVRNMGSNRASQSIIRSVLTLCRDLGITCVIEGVETDAQLEQLRPLQAELIQGYFFSKPMAAHAVPAYINAMSSAATHAEVLVPL